MSNRLRGQPYPSRSNRPAQTNVGDPCEEPVARSRRRERRPSRNWCVPSVALHNPNESLEGAGILRDYDGDIALLLWQTVRDVMLWAEAPQSVRPDLFSSMSTVAQLVERTSGQPETIVRPLKSIVHLLTNPGAAKPELLTRGSMEVAAAARQAESWSTAVAYAQLAAVLSPSRPDPALLAGTCAMEAGQFPRAEAWFWRATALARQQRDGDALASAFVLLGKLFEHAGTPERAERLYRRGYREAQRRRIWAGRWDAAYALFVLARRRGDMATAAQFAIAAERAHRSEQRSAPAHFIELARFWAELGDNRRGGKVIGRLLAHLGELTPDVALAAVALTARVQASTEPRNARKACSRALAMISAGTHEEEVVFNVAMDVAYAAAARADRQSFNHCLRLIHLNAPAAHYEQARVTLANLAEEAFSGESRKRRSG